MRVVGEMTSRERILAAVRGEPLDRPPFAVWRHFFAQEHSGARALAETLADWIRQHRLDLLKYNPRAHYHAEPWGTRYRYSGDAPPKLVRHAIDGRNWTDLEPLPPSHPVFAEMLEGIRVARTLVDVPILMTIFTPLAVLERLAGAERVIPDLRERPSDVLAALEVVTATFSAFAPACIDAGADGIFLATTGWGSKDVIDDAAYARFGRPFDLQVLDAVRDAPLNVLHVCGDASRVVDLTDYPVAALSWNAHGRDNPSVGELLERAGGRAAVGGISDAAFTAPDGRRAREEAIRGLAESGGRRWLAAGGCTIPTASTDVAIAAAREALEERAAAWTR